MQYIKMSYGPDSSEGKASRDAMADALAALSQENCMIIAGVLCAGRTGARAISCKAGLPLFQVMESLSVLCHHGIVRLRFNGSNMRYELADSRFSRLIIQVESFAETLVPAFPAGCAER